MKVLRYIIIPFFMISCLFAGDAVSKNPFFTKLNSPIEYSIVEADDLTEYARIAVNDAVAGINKIKSKKTPTFSELFQKLDGILEELNIAGNNTFMLYWVSPDSLSRVKGLESYQLVDSLTTTIYSDAELFKKLKNFQNSGSYNELKSHRKILVDDIITDFEQSGVNLDEANLERYKKLTKELNQLTSSYSINMNTADEVLTLDENGVAGLPKNFKIKYLQEYGTYEIPIINATRGPVLNNATNEATRKDYYFKFYNRGADKNLDILDSLLKKRYELANIMGYNTYAEYNLNPKMAKEPETVWNFLNSLISLAKNKAKDDIAVLRAMKKNDTGSKISDELNPWDIGYYNNQLLKTEYVVDGEKIREYLPTDQCIEGLFTTYQDLLGYEYKEIKNPPVWHEEVKMYEVYRDGILKGRFYLDLYPRPGKESWFYGVNLIRGRTAEDGYKVPTSMLLGNFTPPSEDVPSLLSHGELSTLFHEFGHIMDDISYSGEFAYQADSKTDFTESMSQIFENWIWDYESLSTFAKHYESGETLPKELFDNMLKAKNVNSGLYTMNSLRRCVYDMNLYDKYDPENPFDTDELWRQIDKELDYMPMHVDGTHYQANWIHINTHPVYMYGYLWAEVYAQDMFTVFKENGLTDPDTGQRYRDLILANGSQRDIVEAVTEFLGRPSNNKAYIESLGLY